MFFRQLFDEESWTFTYLLADEDTRAAVMIDSVLGQMSLYQLLLEEYDLKLRYAVDTHVHADHVTALGALRDEYGAESVHGDGSGAACVSRFIADGEELAFGQYKLQAIATPGHTDDSFSYLLRDGEHAMVFTGDTLLIRGTGRTDFQNGDAGIQYDSLTKKLLVLPDDTIVYPAHDYKGMNESRIGEEKAHNPRLQVADRAAYIALMDNLDLPDPKLMDVAVPANLKCGDV